MRINKDEKIYSYLKDRLPDLIEDEFFSPTTTAVLSVPIKAPEGAITRSESTMDLLERIRKVNLEWVHPGTVTGDEKNNVSATVSVKDNEWDMVRDWMWANKESYSGISLLPFDGGTYKQAPFESITEEEYLKMAELVHEIDLRDVYESTDSTNFGGELACAGGACESDVTNDQLIAVDSVKVETLKL